MFSYIIVMYNPGPIYCIKRERGLNFVSFYKKEVYEEIIEHMSMETGLNIFCKGL